MAHPKQNIEATLVAQGIRHDLAILLIKHSKLNRIKKGCILFREGDLCEHFILVANGSIRVRKIIPDGHEVVLYHIEQGQICSLSNSCLLSGERYLAGAEAEVSSEVLFLARNQFFSFLEQQPQFRSLVFKNNSSGLANLIDLIQSLAFDHMDHRLALALLKQCHDSSSISITHHELALDLATAREVVSRQLKAFEKRGWVKLHRGMIEIIDKDALAGFESPSK